MGDTAEALALEYLLQRGLMLVTKNAASASGFGYLIFNSDGSRASSAAMVHVRWLGG